MKQPFKKILLLTAVSAMGFGLYVAATLANASPLLNIKPAVKPAMKIIRVKKIMRIIKIQENRQHHKWHLGLNRNKHLTKADALTITKAALLMRGRHDLSVGKITPTLNHHGVTAYKIQIMTPGHKIMSLVLLNSRTGHIHPMKLVK